MDENFSWVTKKYTEKLEKNYTDMDGNPGRNLSDLNFRSAMIAKEESQ